MKVLVDTCIWSHVLRHKQPDAELRDTLEDLIRDGRLAIIGPIRQELLSGIAVSSQFKKLRQALDSFSDIVLQTNHYLQAAEFCNTCRKKGLQSSSVDMLICAVAYLEDLLIFTRDSDFTHFQTYLPIRLFTEPKTH